MKKFLAILPLAVAGLFTTLGASRSASVTVTITARVDRFAEWEQSNDVIIEADWSGPINKINKPHTATKSMTLYTNTDTLISARPGLNHGVLTNGSQRLDTAFKMTGDIASPDALFKPAGSGAGEFFHPQNTYMVIHQPGTGAYTINLVAQANISSKSAPDEGLYTCGVILTAEW